MTDERAMESHDLAERSARRVVGERAFEQVLASARTGDGDAFSHLYELLNRRVHAFVSYRGAVDPEGMVNDVFLKVFTNLNRFEGNEIQFSAWVFRIARNRLIDEARARKRRPDEGSLDSAAAAEEAPDDVEASALGRVRTVWVMEQLETLTAEQRDVVVMRVVSDMTIEAIAEVLDKRVGSVKAQQRRAFRTLARNFGDEVVPLSAGATL